MYLNQDPIRVSSDVFKPCPACFRLLALTSILLISVNAAAGTPVSLNLTEVAVTLHEGSTRKETAATRHVVSDLDSAVVVLPPPPPDNGSTGDDVLLRVER